MCHYNLVVNTEQRLPEIDCKFLNWFKKAVFHNFIFLKAIRDHFTFSLFFKRLG